MSYIKTLLLCTSWQRTHYGAHKDEKGLTHLWPYCGHSNIVDNFGCWIKLGIASSKIRRLLNKEILDKIDQRPNASQSNMSHIDFFRVFFNVKKKSTYPSKRISHWPKVLNFELLISQNLTNQFVTSDWISPFIDIELKFLRANLYPNCLLCNKEKRQKNK